MKKLFSSILISFILFTNLVVPVSVFAVGPAFLTPVSFTQPKDGEFGTSTSFYNFSFTFTAPELPDEVASPNTKYNVFFQPYCDGVVTTSGSKYIFNQSKFITGLVKGNQTFPWNGNVVCPYYAKVLRWTLTEVDTTGKILKTYVDTSFKFKLNESYKGYYYVYKDGGGVYSSSSVFKDNASCLTDWNNLASKNPSFKIYSECQYLNDIPSVPKSDQSVAVTPKINVAENKSIYTMLAPIGGITRMDSSGTDPTCAADPKCITNNIGKYLNIIFKLAIGVCAALAVIMLILNGVKYMGDESVFGKTEAKSKMFGAIIGLLIALGAWALLNTINPALTGVGGLNISTASVVLDPEVHGDSPQTAQNGTFCAGKYKTGDAWPSDATERAVITAAGITINAPNCTTVGQSSCTSLAGLNTSGVIALKKTKCTTCEIIITGGTECWLHSSKTQHLPGNSIIDLRPTSTLTSYIDELKNKIKSTGMPFPVYLKDNTKFMRESNPDHYHIINW